MTDRRIREPRVAILGISIECNNFAPPATLASFRDYALLYGQDILEASVIDYWLGYHGSRGFIPAMDRLGPWKPVPVMIADGQAGGSVEHSDYEKLKAELLAHLEASGPLDAVYIVAHGAGRTTEIDDLDGDYLSAVRAVVGPEIPIVATLDLHANLTPQMVDSCDALIGQRTNPHVDSETRAEEAAAVLRRMLNGWRPHKSAVRVPLLTAQIAQLTAAGEPLNEILAAAEADITKGNCDGISVFPGFAFADTRHNGCWLYAYGGDERDLAHSLERLANKVWALRDRFQRETLDIGEAVAIAAASDATQGLLIFADIADNPGGGASGKTTFLLDAFLSAGIEDGIFAPFVDGALASEAARVGVGNSFTAIFNDRPTDRFMRRLVCEAKVLWCGNGDYDSRYGVYAGSRVPLGTSCVLEICGNKVIVISAKQQLLGEDFISRFGINVRAARFVVAKSRGHFRAGFAHVAQDDNIYEVDATGLTTARLPDVPWQHISRPIAPLDKDASFGRMS